MVVSFVSADTTTLSHVTWGTAGQTLNRLATGFARSYSQLLFFGDWVATPEMGLPTEGTGLEAQLALQNTTGWAIDPITKKPGSSWHQPNGTTWAAVNKGLGAYKNPASYYNSAVIHTVTLSPLMGGERYDYRVAGDGRIFTFRMPPRSSPSPTYSAKVPSASAVNSTEETPMESMVIGLTSDLGQTAVSNASVDALVTMLPDVILLAGDLSYADGWMPRWDTYGLMMERLAARVPIMTAAGNHEVGNGEAWVSYNARLVVFWSSGPLVHSLSDTD